MALPCVELFCQDVKQEICRLCLRSTTTLEPLFTSAAESAAGDDLAGKIFKCTHVSISPDPSFPQSICSECLVEFEVAEKFRTKCLKSNKILHGYAQVKDRTVFKRSNSIDHAEETNMPIKAEEVHTDGSESSGSIKIVKEENEFTSDSLEVDTGLDKPISKSALIKKPHNSPHICSQCGKVLKTEASLLRHSVAMHTRSRAGRVTGHGAERRFHCTECSYSSPHSQSLVYHIRRHTGERPHRCECGQAFTQPSSLAAHRKTHSDATFYTCPQCGKQFKYKDVYERHKTVHSDAKYSCVVCGKALKTRHTLDAHMNRHLGLKNYSCETCGAAFVTNVELINHRKKHDGPRRFQCKLCSYKTYLKKLLDVHIKRHTGQREYKCELCPYDCHTRSDLKCHQRTHTKEKRYACAACGQRFVYSTSLNKHMLRRHSLKFVWSSTVDRRVVKVIS